MYIKGSSIIFFLNVKIVDQKCWPDWQIIVNLLISIRVCMWLRLIDKNALLRESVGVTSRDLSKCDILISSEREYRNVVCVD